MASDLLTVADVAALLRVTDETVRTWLRTNQLHGYNLGGRTGWRVPTSEIPRFLRENSGKRQR
ncbi:MAG: helix-turn-helix domain-containing protein [Chloroflexota bacterium]|nr:MAG: DNA-binding protein [Chloroflexota bacterium]